jgi:hypothetical protein
MMSSRVPTRVRVEVVLAAASAALGLVTLVWKDWIEVVFRVDPDHGDGSLEWWIVIGLLVVAVALFALSRWEIQRAARASVSS